jgi:uncharacterized protein YcfL
MKKYLLLLMMAATVLASCSKDEDANVIDEKQPTTTLTAKDIVGTWSFINPTAAEIVIKGTNSSLVNQTKKDLIGQLADNTTSTIVVTYKSDMTCVAVDNSDGEVNNFKGTYSIVKGRLQTTLMCDGEEFEIRGMLEKKGATIYINSDKQAFLDYFNRKLLTDKTLTSTDKADLLSTIANTKSGISEIRYAIKMVKK